MAAWQFTRTGRKAAQDEWVALLTLLSPNPPMDGVRTAEGG